MKLVDDGVLKLGKTQSQSAPPHRAVHAAPLPSPRRALGYRAACQTSVPPRDQAMQRLWSRYIALTLQPKLRQRLLPPRPAPRCRRRRHHHQSHAVPNSSITNCARALLEIMGSQSTALPTWGTVCWQSNNYFQFQFSKCKFMRESIFFSFALVHSCMSTTDETRKCKSERINKYLLS